MLYDIGKSSDAKRANRTGPVLQERDYQGCLLEAM